MAESEEEQNSLLMKVKRESEKAGLKLIIQKLRSWHLLPVSSFQSLSRVRLFCDPMDCSLPGSFVHGIFQARVPEWVAIAFSATYLRLFIFLPAILIPACVSPTRAFLMMYSAYKLNKQGDNIQPQRTPFPIWNQSVVPCPVLTVAS